ncbi:MAG: hypothetical protein KAS32_06170 [Candidatus Peribacteraceae bacterium]|nr:hypothetical protein [Candidatus Peribacteraceae bacterium]
MTIFKTPEFYNTRFHYETRHPSGSHHHREMEYITSNTTPPHGIVSLGHTALSLLTVSPDSHIFLPLPTPRTIVERLLKFTPNIHILGSSYNECIDLSSTYMFQHSITNITPGIIQHYPSNTPIVDEILTHQIPDYIFVPSINLNLASDICLQLRNRNHENIIVIACILPDHFLSPRFNFNYNCIPYYSSITNDDHRYTRPSLSTTYKHHTNIIINTVKNPDSCFAQYYPHYPQYDPLNYITMHISTQYPSTDHKVVILSGTNLQETTP